MGSGAFAHLRPASDGRQGRQQNPRRVSFGRANPQKKWARLVATCVRTRASSLGREIIGKSIRPFDKSQCKEPVKSHFISMLDWQPIVTAPFGSDLQLSVIENAEVYALVFPCRRTQDGWVHAKTGRLVLVRPTHWRNWATD